VARASVDAVGLDRTEVVVGDAAALENYAGAVPADLVLVCGVFGNISDDDIRQTVLALPQLCSLAATVVWTRHRVDPDLTPTIRRWFAEAGFDEVAFVGPTDRLFGVGAHRYRGEPAPLETERTVFEFVW
jgi:hypothetical protein